MPAIFIWLILGEFTYNKGIFPFYCFALIVGCIREERVMTGIKNLRSGAHLPFGIPFNTP
jgi:hypothetical protein